MFMQQLPSAGTWYTKNSNSEKGVMGWGCGPACSESMRVSPQHPCKELGVVVCALEFSAGEVDRRVPRAHWLASLT